MYVVAIAIASIFHMETVYTKPATGTFAVHDIFVLKPHLESKIVHMAMTHDERISKYC